MSKIDEWKDKYGYDSVTDSMIVYSDELSELIQIVRDERDPKWISVDDALPIGGQWVLALCLTLMATTWL